MENGHYLLIAGQAGTGKTYTVKNSAKRLRQLGNIVALTCYTGNACSQYKRLGAVTLNNFFFGGGDQRMIGIQTPVYII